MTVMTLKPVVRQPVYLQVAEQLREAILDGRFALGMPLPSERRLQETFGVGRTTVREALRALEAQGLVGPGPGGWRSVASPSLDAPLREALVQLVRLEQVDLDDLVDLRLILEPAAVERAARHHDELSLARARACLDEMQQPGIEVRVFQDADVRFHVALAEASGNRALHLVMLTLRDVIDRYMRAMAESVADVGLRLPKAAADHAAILAAIERGDGKAAVDRTVEHLIGSRRVLHDWTTQNAARGATRSA